MKLSSFKKRASITLLHVWIFGACLAGAFLLRFDFVIPPSAQALLWKSLGIAIAAKFAVFQVFGLNRGWRYPGVSDLVRLLVANSVSSAVFLLGTVVLLETRFPRSMLCIDYLLCFLTTAGLHCSVRLARELMKFGTPSNGGRNVLIYGAGSTGLNLAREILNDPGSGYRVAGFLDDDPAKWDSLFMGVPVLGGGHEAAGLAERLARNPKKRVEELIIAMPSCTGSQMQRVLEYCKATGLPSKTIPGVRELLRNESLSKQIRSVSLTDLLGRPRITIEDNRIRQSLAGKSVLVTGAAGSIGSEICRQLAVFEPRCLIALDQAESDLHDTALELRHRYPVLALTTIVADVRNRAGIEECFRRHPVDVVFHAAAYKHVPMMEAQPLEAIVNNVFGTKHVLESARNEGVSCVVMISSDKAVKPTNIMGATKRVSELMVSALPRSGTKAVSVRFGNVLGSRGSVVPLFRQQIAAGGPVTVTHPEMSRYFMTIPEAVQLVLIASTMGKGSETFVLDMGSPVRIVDLAKNMIQLAGRIPEKDIEIKFVGTRPGEKLHEELVTDDEHVIPTWHEKIRIFKGTRADWPEIQAWVQEMEQLVNRRDERGAVLHLARLVPEFKPDPLWAEEAQVAANGAALGRVEPHRTRRYSLAAAPFKTTA